MNTTNLEVVFLRRHGKMFEKIMNYIKDFLNNTPEDIYDFSDKFRGIFDYSL